MNNAVSLHIGLNRIDRNTYGTDGILSGCHNDAKSMQSIASSLGYKTQTLLDEDATAGKVVKAISDAAKLLTSGDIFMLSYAGHGSQVKDITSDEDDGMDETWVLYDRMLIDDELYALWSQFKAGVRIVVVSDSCHSGTVVRELYERLIQGDGGCNGHSRLFDPEIAQEIFDRMSSCYEPIKYGMRGDQVGNVSANIILLSGCQDNQLSGDGVNNGLYTSKLIDVWAGGAFAGTYNDFVSAIRKKMPFSQTPSLYEIGGKDELFLSQKPFSIEFSRAGMFGVKEQSDSLDLVLHMDKSFVSASSDKELLDFFRTDGAESLSLAYVGWKEVAARFTSLAPNAKSLIKCETNLRVNELGYSISVKGVL